MIIDIFDSLKKGWDRRKIHFKFAMSQVQCVLCCSPALEYTSLGRIISPKNSANHRNLEFFLESLTYLVISKYEHATIMGSVQQLWDLYSNYRYFLKCFIDMDKLTEHNVIFCWAANEDSMAFNTS